MYPCALRQSRYPHVQVGMSSATVGCWLYSLAIVEKIGMASGDAGVVVVVRDLDVELFVDEKS
jgi:hypothetical protein